MNTLHLNIVAILKWSHTYDDTFMEYRLFIPWNVQCSDMLTTQSKFMPYCRANYKKGRTLYVHYLYSAILLTQVHVWDISRPVWNGLCKAGDLAIIALENYQDVRVYYSSVVYNIALHYRFSHTTSPHDRILFFNKDLPQNYS